MHKRIVSRIEREFNNTVLTIRSTMKNIPPHIILSHCSIMHYLFKCIHTGGLYVPWNELCGYKCDLCKFYIRVENKKYDIEFIFKDHEEKISYTFLCENVPDMGLYILCALYEYEEECLSLEYNTPIYASYEEWIKHRYILPDLHDMYPTLPPNNLPIEKRSGYLDYYCQGASYMLYQLLYYMGNEQIVKYFDTFYPDSILDFNKCINKFILINQNNCKGLFRIDNVMDQYRVEFFFTTYRLYIETPWYTDKNEALQHVCNNLKEIMKQSKATSHYIHSYLEEAKSNVKSLIC